VVILLALVTAPVWPSEVFVTPDGETCVQLGQSNVVSCSGGNTDNSAADRAQEVRNDRVRMKQYQDCLRTSDWPGKPGRSECASMYGQ
jgi:hypothetical protein